MEVTFENIKQAIVEAEISGKLRDLDADTSFDAIGLDSLDRYNVLLSVEEAFGIIMPDEKAETLDTIGKLVEAVQSLK